MKILLSLSMFLLAGCSSLVTKPVSESDKITTDTYDGRWSVTVTNTPKQQRGPANWIFNCSGESGRSLGVISVVDGVAKWSWDEDRLVSAFVNNDGKFRFEVPTGASARATTRSESSISRGDMTALVYGSLEAGQGKYTLGIAEFANAGCTSDVEYDRL